MDNFSLGHGLNPFTPSVKPWANKMLFYLLSLWMKLQCDHSNESYWAVLSSGAACFWQFFKMNFKIFFLRFELSTLGSERVKGLTYTRMYFLCTAQGKASGMYHPPIMMAVPAMATCRLPMLLENGQQSWMRCWRLKENLLKATLPQLWYDSFVLTLYIIYETCSSSYSDYWIIYTNTHQI